MTLNEQEKRCIFYTAGILKKCEVKIPKCYPLVLCILPDGKDEEIQYEDFKNFIDIIYDMSPKEKKGSRTGIGKAEDTIKEKPVNPFECVEAGSDRIVSFDVIFVWREKTDSDIMEISQLNRSFLRKILSDIDDARRSTEASEHWNLTNLWEAFFQIFKDKSEDQIRYKGHLIKVLPKILKGGYYQDPTLIKILTNKLLYEIRNNSRQSSISSIKNLLVNYKFIEAVQKGGTMIHQKSWELGELLAEFSFPLTKHISSFWKQEIGHLHISAARPEKLWRVMRNWDILLIRHDGDHDRNLAGKKVIYRSALIERARTLFKEVEAEKSYNVDSCIHGFLSKVNRLDYINSQTNGGN